MSIRTNLWSLRLLLVVAFTLIVAFLTGKVYVDDQLANGLPSNNLPAQQIIVNSLSAGFATFNLLVIIDIVAVRRGDIGDISGYLGPILIGLLINTVFLLINLWNGLGAVILV